MHHNPGDKVPRVLLFVKEILKSSWNTRLSNSTQTHPNLNLSVWMCQEILLAYQKPNIISLKHNRTLINLLRVLCALLMLGRYWKLTQVYRSQCKTSKPVCVYGSLERKLKAYSSLHITYTYYLWKWKVLGKLIPRVQRCQIAHSWSTG